MSETGTVSLLICDDHKILTDALATMVGLDDGFALIAPPVHTAEEAIALAQEHLPDVVLMDIVFKAGGMGGIEATRMIKEASPLDEGGRDDGARRGSPARGGGRGGRVGVPVEG